MGDRVIADLAVAGLLLVAGIVAGLLSRGRVEWRWLGVAVALVLLNNLLLARFSGLLPETIGNDWNWTGKLLALAGTLAIAALPAFGWRRSGLTLRQRAGSLRSAIPVALVYCLYPIGLALLFGGSEPDAETLAYQLTLPGLEEEPFYRGILLLALDRAFLGRVALLGVEWGWGAILSCLLFGAAHGFGYDDGAFSLDALTVALTGLPAFVGVWLRYRTGSLVLPVLVHNFGNSIRMALPA